MKSSNEENQEWKTAYRSYIQEELVDPSTKKAKQDLINTHFRIKSLLWQVWLVPAIGILMIAVIFIFKIHMPHESAKAARTPIMPAGDLLTKTPPGFTIPKLGNVSVMQVDSKIGPTMVYQKMYQDVLITVVWVFPGGNQ